MRRRRYRPFATPGMVAALLFVVLFVCRLLCPTERPAPELFVGGNSYRVQRVVDGDTLLLEDGLRVRLIGVDCPETKHPDRPIEPWGAEASEFTRQHVEGRHVTLQFDRERRDKYQRVLAYVYLDEWFLNEELIRAGLARAATHFAYSDLMKRRFREAEQAAREAQRGLWQNQATSAPDR